MSTKTCCLHIIHMGDNCSCPCHDPTKIILPVSFHYPIPLSYLYIPTVSETVDAMVASSHESEAPEKFVTWCVEMKDETDWNMDLLEKLTSFAGEAYVMDLRPKCAVLTSSFGVFLNGVCTAVKDWSVGLGVTVSEVYRKESEDTEQNVASSNVETRTWEKNEKPIQKPVEKQHE